MLLQIDLNESYNADQADFAVNLINLQCDVLSIPIFVDFVYQFSI